MLLRLMDRGPGGSRGIRRSRGWWRRGVKRDRGVKEGEVEKYMLRIF